ncbi:MAG: hypothetical protein KDA51_04095 [Planctomycetales bacterium]|nr:hypothetical protein [Planctomycetales bacterium]MCA9180602.1 hypothetical protein [Planctomycetales bacterium]
MNDSLSTARWYHNTTTIIAGALVLGGFLLTNVSWWFLLLAAAGTLGPGILREFGWLRDRDEFQRLAAYRAGYHAYLTSGLVAFVLVAFIRSGEKTLEYSQGLATLFLALLWFTWLLSSLISYWGIQKAAFRILIGFGSAWLLFAILSNTGSEWTSWAALLLHPLLAAPFFALAWLSRRWPRITGVLLLVVAASLFSFFGYFRRDNLALVNQASTFVLFIGPLLSSGIALVNVENGFDESEVSADE